MNVNYEQRPAFRLRPGDVLTDGATILAVELNEFGYVAIEELTAAGAVERYQLPGGHKRNVVTGVRS